MTQTNPEPSTSAAERGIALLERLVPSLERTLKAIEREQRSAGAWRLFRRAGLVLIFVVGFVVYLTFYGAILGVRPSIVAPTVAVVNIRGEIGGSDLASADRIVPILDNVCSQSTVKALVLHIDSPGGAPSDAERIGSAVDRCKVLPVPKGAVKGTKAERRPVYAAIDALGASAAYMVAVHADRIVANPAGMVGSIGVIVQGFKVNNLMQKVGVDPYTYATGPLKATLSPYSPETPQQQALIKQLANGALDVFKHDVLLHRPHLDVSTPDLWSGRLWIAADAKRIGLIDQVAVLEDVLHSDFPHLSVAQFQPSRGFRDALSVETWVRALRAEAAQQPFELR